MPQTQCFFAPAADRNALATPAAGQIVIKYGGTLERYAGDGVMVVFNDPVPVENPALQAVLMALEMRNAIGALTETWRRLGHEIGFGIGIAHGFATLGNSIVLLKFRSCPRGIPPDGPSRRNVAADVWIAVGNFIRPRAALRVRRASLPLRSRRR